MIKISKIKKQYKKRGSKLREIYNLMLMLSMHYFTPSNRYCYYCNEQLHHAIGITRDRFVCRKCGRSYKPNDSHALKKKGKRS